MAVQIKSLTYRKENVALLIDHENLEISIKNHWRVKEYDIDTLLKFAEKHGKVISKKVYGFTGTQLKEDFFRSKEVEIVYRGKGRKSTADPQMNIDIMKMLPNVDHFIIATSDKDFIPILSEIKNSGKNATIVYIKEAISDFLKKMCMKLNFEFYEYREISNN